MIGKRPPGFTSPLNTRATGLAPAGPGYQPSTIASTQGSTSPKAKARPLNNTIIVFLPKLDTALTSSS